LSALAGQVYPREQFEVIVVDDGSAFDVEEIKARFGARFTDDFRLIKQTNAGPAAARNVGAAVARHEFLAFIDDDCAPHPDWLRKLSDVLMRNPNALVGGRSCNPLSDNLYAEASQTIIDVVYAHFNRNHHRAVFFPSNNMAMSRKRYLEIGGFDTSFRWSEDRDLCDRVAARGWQLVLAPDAIVDHGHVSGLIEFFKQHFGFGRGAWRFHRTCVRRGTGGFKPEVSFYLKCFLEPFRMHTLGRAIRLAMLMVIWQVANTCGFFFQALQDIITGASGPAVEEA
jgi:GT2 family glycosyltransferase